MRTYRLILADDHAMVRAGVRKLIESQAGLQVIGEAGDGLSLLKMLKKKTPDMVILDIAMPGMRGLEAAREIQNLHPHIHVLILSMHKHEEFVSMALAAGARGFILKEDTGEELLLAIERIRSGGTYLSRNLVAQFQGDILAVCQAPPKKDAATLTARERQVLQLIAEGHKDRQISDLLCISVRTVQRHHANIRAKLNCRHTADLVRFALSSNLLDPQCP
jgi:DNA-binding NarL/FixJ family response regulator